MIFLVLLGRSPEYPQRIRVASVFEPFDCSLLVCLEANFLIFSSFILLFLYSTVQKSAVQYSIRPNLEWARKGRLPLVNGHFESIDY